MVASYLSGAVAKCALMLQIPIDDSFIQILTSDLIDKYSYESIEDLVICLRKGRQGFYGNNYNKLNMIVISDWMQKHLEEKAISREKFIKQNYQTTKEPLKVVDYEAFKARIAEKKPKIAKGQKEMLDEYIEKVCQAMEVDTKELFEGSRKKEIADVRGLIKTYQKEVLKMTREQIKEYWHVCSD